MKVLKNFESRMDAEIAKGFLESKGITSFVTADDEGGLHPALGAQAGAQLNVADEDFETAQEALKEWDGQ